jgi:hypothetical protein
MNKFTIHTYEITYEELMDAIKSVILRNDPGANINLGTVNAEKWLELDNNKENSDSRRMVSNKSTMLLSVETSR